MPADPLYRDPDYVQGQLHAMQALLLGVASLLLERDQFREESLRRLEVLRTALLSERVSDARRRALDDCEAWLKRATS